MRGGVLTKFCLLLLLGIALSACQPEQPRIVVITSTPVIPAILQPTATIRDLPDVTPTPEPTTVVIPPLALSSVPSARDVEPTANPTLPTVDTEPIPAIHQVTSGETLSIIAGRYGVSLQSILDVNNLENPDIISVGQAINLPELPTNFTPGTKLIADGKLVRGPDSMSFDVAQFVSEQPGYIRIATDQVTTRLADGAAFDENLSAAEIVERVSREYSVDPRILLAILEYRAGWLSNPQPLENLLTHPVISEENSPGIDRSGLYRQLSWLADQLNRAYYGWKYRDLRLLELIDGTRFLYNGTLNPGSISLQYVLSRFRTTPQWEFDISRNGLYRIYYAYFGDPLTATVEPVVADNLTQPEFSLPFGAGETWFFTGGPHGGWGSGSAWAALDFAPPDERPPGSAFCYTSTAWVRAVAAGIISYSNDGVVIIDVDGDGDERTGWSIMYLHIAQEDRITAGTRVNTGDAIGHASCAGGFSTATHLHIARRYNGEWLPTDCDGCALQFTVPDFVMSGWETVGIENQEYQGYLVRGDVQLQAEQGRENPINQISFE